MDNINDCYGYVKLKENLESYLQSVRYMVGNNELSENAANYLISRFSEIEKLCTDYIKSERSGALEHKSDGNVDVSWGYARIKQKLGFFMNDINDMLKSGDIKMKAAEYLLHEFEQASGFCDDYCKAYSIEQKSSVK